VLLAARSKGTRPPIVAWSISDGDPSLEGGRIAQFRAPEAAVGLKVLKKAAVASKKKPSDAVAIVSYDEKPGHPSHPQCVDERGEFFRYVDGVYTTRRSEAEPRW
jgi:hypothetical protein